MTRTILTAALFLLLGACGCESETPPLATETRLFSWGEMKNGVDVTDQLEYVGEEVQKLPASAPREYHPTRHELRPYKQKPTTAQRVEAKLDRIIQLLDERLPPKP